MLSMCCSKWAFQLCWQWQILHTQASRIWILNSPLYLCNFTAMFMAVSGVTSDLLQCNWGKSLTQFVYIYGRKPREERLFLFKVQEEFQHCWRKACKPRLQPAAPLLWHTIFRMFLKCLEVWYLAHCTWGTKACKSTYMLNDFSTLTQRHLWRDWVEEEEQRMGIWNN